MEATIRSMTDSAERTEKAARESRSDLRKALLAVLGSLLVTVIVFVASQWWNSRQAADTAQVVRETIRQMETSAKQP